ncbi:MAG: MFS transporter [Parachlamydiaceae bacterium]|nr:MFS transporter [Parachlamydiaceae bacterium]
MREITALYSLPPSQQLEDFMHKRAFLTGVIGNLLEHYDTALFGLLAPFIAPLFFHSHDPFTALILTYAMIPLGILTRPLGSLFFGWIADRFGRKQALCWSLIGTAIATASIGCLPTSLEIGAFSPLLLAIARLLQSFFAAGEAPGGAIFVLEQTDAPKRSLMSSFFDASTIGGILIASVLVTLVSMQGWIDTGWRYLFWTGGLIAIFGVLLRLKKEENEIFIPAMKINLFKELYKHKSALFAITLAAGFSYTTFSLSFVLMNGYIPLVTSITKAEVIQINTLLLTLDLFLLPFFGLMSKKFGKERVMFFGAFASFICGIPLFSSFGPSSSLFVVTAVRFFIVLFGVAFAAPYHAWAMEQVPSHCRSTVLCFGYTLGSQLIGMPTSAICLWAYQQTEWVGAPALYLLPVSFGAMLSLRIAQKAKKSPLYSVQSLSNNLNIRVP